MLTFRKWAAKECVVYPGVRRVSATVRNGKYEQQDHDIYDPRTGRSTRFWSEWHDVSLKPWLFPTEIQHLLHPTTGAIDRFAWEWQPPPWPSHSTQKNRATFGLSYISAMSIQFYFNDLFHGSVATAGDTLRYYVDRPDSTNYNFRFASTGLAQDALQSILLGDMVGCSPGQDPMECAMLNTAKAIDKTFRDAAYIEYGTEKANMTVGKNMVEEVHIKIQWPWLIVPVLVVRMVLFMWGRLYETSIH